MRRSIEAAQCVAQLLKAYYMNQYEKILQLISGGICWVDSNGQIARSKEEVKALVLRKARANGDREPTIRTFCEKELGKTHLSISGEIVSFSVSQGEEAVQFCAVCEKNEVTEQWEVCLLHLFSPDWRGENRLKQFTLALRSSFDELLEFNITQNRYKVLYHVPDKYSMPENEGILLAGIADTAAQRILPADAQRFLNFFHLDDLREKFKREEDIVSEDFRKLQKNGEYKWARFILVLLPNEEKDEIYLCLIQDIDEKKHTKALEKENRELLQQQQDDERYRIIIEQIGTIVIEYNAEANSVFIPKEAYQFTFMQEKNTMREKFFLGKKDVHPDDWKKAMQMRRQLLEGKKKVEEVIRLQRSGEGYLWCRVAITIVYNQEHKMKRCIITINNIDQSVKERIALEYRAEHDELTGYYNYSKFKREVSKLLKKRDGKKYALWYSDLKNFKLINDIYGYDIGDRILKYWADILASNIGKEEVFARVSADHFVSLRLYEQRSEMEEWFNYVSKKMEEYKEQSNQKINLEIASGIYCIESDGEILSVEDMIDRASIAQKSVKDLSGSRYAFYSEKMRQELISEKEMEAEMHQALENGEFCVFLQPIVDIQNGEKVIGAEALVRWKHPGKGMVLPGDFIPLFEKNGFIVELDAFVFEAVCQYQQKQLQAGKKPIKISVNLSKVSAYQTGFTKRYIALKKQYNLPDGVLELECTETIVAENVSWLNDVIKEMRKEGVQFSLDDFGSGFSSLNLLKDIVVDALKLDRAFLQNNLYDKRGYVIMSSILLMARALGLKTVVEGVEMKEQVEMLKTIGCNYVQGFYFGKPIEMDRFEEKYLSANG